MFVPYGVAQTDLGIEIPALGIQHVDIIDTAAPVLQIGQFDVFAGSIAQSDLQRGRFADVTVSDYRIVGFLENLQHLLLVPQPKKKKQGGEEKRSGTNENGRVGQRPYARGRAYDEKHYE